jgi:S1-C subfamily serine protease
MRDRSLFRPWLLPSLLFGVVLGALVSVLITRSLGPSPQTAAAANARTVSQRGELDADERTNIAVFKAVSPSVAYITTQVQRVDFWTRNVLEIPQGTGSGFLWDDRGHVVTNFHVIRGADGARVSFGGEELEASLVGVAPDFDIAVLRVRSATRRQPLEIGTSADLLVGQKVFAVGNPFGLDHTLTTGIVSALGRSIQSVTNIPIEGVIQTDAAINPGNSGGPLLDSAGRLVGMNTAIYSPSGASAGIGFAVPVDTIARVVPELIANGRMVRPRMGIRTLDLPADTQQGLGVKGVAIMTVEPGSGAERAGLRPAQETRDGRVRFGDIVIEIEGKAVTTSGELQGRLGSFKPDDTITVTVWRDGRSIKVPVTLQAARER